MAAPIEPCWRLLVRSESFAVLPTGTDAGTCLVFQRSSGRIYTTEMTTEVSDSTPIYGLVGIVHLGLHSFLVVISKAETVVRLLDMEIMSVDEVQTLPFGTSSLPDEVGRYLTSLAKLLTSGFYFSYHYDLTHSLESNKSSRSSRTLHETADLRFYWNHAMYTDLLAQNIEPRFCLPIVQGFVTSSLVLQLDAPATLVLISRRSCQRAGTRYNARGVDDEGNVGNFVETEQIVHIRDTLFSYVQTRGSAPIFWTQSGLAAQVSLSKSKEMTNEAFRKHIQTSVRIYGHITLINLLDVDKPHERMLTESMEHLLTMHRSEMEGHVGYLYFNFNKACKGDQYHVLAEIIPKLSPSLDYYSYFSLQNEEVVTKQRGVTRINCLDSLDRTNVVMGRIAWRALSQQMETVGVSIRFGYDDSTPGELLRSFKDLWADTGDMLSRQYTGARSTISSVTRHGKRGFKGLVEQGLNSLRRFYEANVEDGMKQEVIDLMLGRHHLAKGRSLTELLDRVTRIRQAEYTRYFELSVKVACWNVDGLQPQQVSEAQLCTWLLDDDASEPPFMFFIGLQDLVSRKSGLQGNSCSPDLVAGWTETLLLQLNQLAAYVVVKTEEVSGTYLGVFVLEEGAGTVSAVESDSVRLNEEGKGAAVVRLCICHTSVCCWNVSLQSSQDQISERLSQLVAIERSAFQQLSPRPKLQIDLHDVKILLGNLNFRIAMSRNEVLQAIETRTLDPLRANDQLVLAQKHTHPVLSKYTEPPCSFLPTSKYASMSDQYEGDAPAWRQRVLYAGTQARALSYTRSEAGGSRHRPISSVLEVSIREVDEEAMRSASKS